MKDFKSQYYICNTPWKRKLDITKLKKFDDIKYIDTIIFHFDLCYSVFKVGRQTGYSKDVIISAINICLRYYNIIKSLYPYNKIRVIIHLKNNIKIALDKESYQKVIDIIPNFAVCDNLNELEYFNTDNYKHIIYGGIRPDLKNKQIWSVIDGKLIIQRK